jgi:hypothetical protein
MTKLDIKPKTYYCNDCEEELTEDNTGAYGGFDGGNYLASRTYGETDSSIFTKCDSCFDADNDRALDSMYE